MSDWIKMEGIQILLPVEQELIDSKFSGSAKLAVAYLMNEITFWLQENIEHELNDSYNSNDIIQSVNGAWSAETRVTEITPPGGPTTKHRHCRVIIRDEMQALHFKLRFG